MAKVLRLVVSSSVSLLGSLTSGSSSRISTARKYGVSGLASIASLNAIGWRAKVLCVDG